MKIFFAILFGFAAAAPNLNRDQELHIQMIRNELKENAARLKRENPGLNWNDPAVNMDTLQLIQAQGYPAKAYDVTTQDGFILTLHRIEAARFQSPAGGTRGPPVLLQHGLEASSACWVNDMWDQSLPFILADNGYDVWLGNVRGNTYSQRHVSLSPDSKEFWEWSFDEMAKYDIPAMIDYIRQSTGYPKIFYIGHSQGTLVGFTGFSENPILSKAKIRAFFALAPVGTVGSITSKISLIAPYTRMLDIFFNMVGHYSFFPDNELMLWLRNQECKDVEGEVEQANCNNLFYIIVGGPSANQNSSRAAVKLAHFPAGTSSQNMVHFGQLVDSNKCQKYDLGFLDNRQKYGSFNPPEYDLTKLRVPTAIFSGGLDKMADPTDVAWLRTQIQSALIGDFYYEDYVHSDFIFALNARTLVYNKILDLMRKY